MDSEWMGGHYLHNNHMHRLERQKTQYVTTQVDFKALFKTTVKWSFL